MLKSSAWPEPQKRLVAQRAGTKLVYLEQIASGVRRPSPRLCKGLLIAEPRLTLSSLRPDIAELCEMIANGNGRKGNQGRAKA